MISMINNIEISQSHSCYLLVQYLGFNMIIFGVFWTFLSGLSWLDIFGISYSSTKKYCIIELFSVEGQHELTL